MTNQDKAFIIYELYKNREYVQRTLAEKFNMNIRDVSEVTTNFRFIKGKNIPGAVNVKEETFNFLEKYNSPVFEEYRYLLE